MFELHESEINEMNLYIKEILSRMIDICEVRKSYLQKNLATHFKNKIIKLKN
jgi:hypothetical protein